MNNQETPVGKPFSHVYIEKGEPQRDSERFRKRLGKYCGSRLSDYKSQIGKKIEIELGVDIPHGVYGYKLEDFFINSKLRDVLDSITFIWTALNLPLASGLIDVEAQKYATYWLEFVQRVFEEENLGYRVDERGGVHYFVDEEFERNRLSVLSCLAGSRYTAVATAFEDSHQKLDSEPPDTKASVRSIFEAVEILYKLLIDAPEKDRLNSSGVRNKLKPMFQKIYEKDETARIAAEHLTEGLCDWIDALHMYRHGQKVEEPSNPPMELAIEIVSSGATYLRWLVEIDKFIHKL
jgi:hypothetical protein